MGLKERIGLSVVLIVYRHIHMPLRLESEVTNSGFPHLHPVKGVSSGFIWLQTLAFQ